MTKRFCLLMICLWALAGIQSQPLKSFLKNQVPVLELHTLPWQSSFEVYSRFGMSDSLFLAFNKAQVNAKASDELLNLTFAHLLKLQCPDKACEPVFFEAGQKDDFKKIAGYFRMESPYILKAMNPSLEAVSPGDSVWVGFLPKSLLDFENKTPQGTETVSNQDDASESAHSLLEAAVFTQRPEVYRGKGVFESEYQRSGLPAKNGKAAHFRSLGGWYDGKFFLLSNDIAAGRVVRIIHPRNGLFIYAKVIGPMPRLKNEGRLLTRLSNAACAALDVWDEQDFDVIIEE